MLPDMTVCRHGGLRRKCETCDAWEEVAELRERLATTEMLLRANHDANHAPHQTCSICAFLAAGALAYRARGKAK